MSVMKLFIHHICGLPVLFQSHPPWLTAVAGILKWEHTEKFFFPVVNQGCTQQVQQHRSDFYKTPCADTLCLVNHAVLLLCAVDETHTQL